MNNIFPLLWFELLLCLNFTSSLFWVLYSICKCLSHWVQVFIWLKPVKNQPVQQSINTFLQLRFPDMTDNSISSPSDSPHCQTHHYCGEIAAVANGTLTVCSGDWRAAGWCFTMPEQLKKWKNKCIKQLWDEMMTVITAERQTYIVDCSSVRGRRGCRCCLLDVDCTVFVTRLSLTGLLTNCFTDSSQST